MAFKNLFVSYCLHHQNLTPKSPLLVLMLHNFMFLGGHISDLHVRVSPEPQSHDFAVILKNFSPFYIVHIDDDVTMRIWWSVSS